LGGDDLLSAGKHNPDLPRVGEEITVTIKTMKNDWLAGLVELTAEELNAIGEYTVLVGQEQFITPRGPGYVQGN